MRFIADSMLGRLARWLRLLGYDTLYYSHIEDRLLLRISREDNRILLTRDTRIVKVKGLRHFLLLQENDSFGQLKNVIHTFNLNLPGKSGESKKPDILSRCAICNTELDTISKIEVRDTVPEYVYRTNEIFKHCRTCGKTYWNGTHPGKFRIKLSEILLS